MSKDTHSRVNKYEKRRKYTKLTTYLMSIGAVLLLVLIGSWIFGGAFGDEADNLAQNEQELNDDNDGSFLVLTEEDKEKNEEEKEEGSEMTEEDEETEKEDQEDKDEEEAKEEDEEDENNDELEMEKVDSSDNNVKEAYTADWEPVGTKQTGEKRAIVYTSGSQDRIEIKEAASVATGIPGDDMIEWWVGNDGDQKVVATVSDRAETETYRVYLSWIDGEGWQPTKVETLIVNDKK